MAKYSSAAAFRSVRFGEGAPRAARPLLNLFHSLEKLVPMTATGRAMDRMPEGVAGRRA
jgi:hypothetical protein